MKSDTFSVIVKEKGESFGTLPSGSPLHSIEYNAFTVSL